MNYTITFSPSIDYIIDNQDNLFKNNNLTRINSYYLFPGGKGINASFILNQIGIKNKAIVFEYGKTADLFFELLKTNNITNIESIKVKSDIDIRINIKYFDNKNKFEINGPAPKIDDSAFEGLLKKLSKLSNKDIVFIMGKCDEKILFKLLDFVKSKNAKFVIDIDSDIFTKVLDYKPLVIKPNIDELESILKKKLNSKNEIIKEMKLFKEKGIENVLVSLGSKGSLLLDNNNELYEINFKKLDTVKSTVGCGDTLLSSYTAFKYEKNLNSEESIRQATALSMSTASNWFLGKIDEIPNFIKSINIKKIG